MAYSSEVTLPADVEPCFPDGCVVCESDADSTATIRQHSANGWLTYFTPILIFFSWKKTHFPICRGCKLRFFVQRRVRQFGTIVLLAAVVFVAMPYFKDWDRTTAKLAVLGIACLALVPNVAIEVWWPRFFEVTASGKRKTYEFASPSYAAQFAVLNSRDVLETDGLLIEVTERDP
ncbi:MAG: hypothetical protein AAF790_01635 [Planctomycetota bacterium]